MTMQEPALTNYHCHTNIDPCCDRELTPAYYAGLLGGTMRRAVITDHGFMHYLADQEAVLWSGRWMEEPAHFDAALEAGNARLRAALRTIRDVGNANIFAGIETDMMRDGRLTHDPALTDEFDVILCGPHFLPWVEKLEAPEARERAWLDYMDALLDNPAVDVVSHPFRWISNVNKGQLSDDAIRRVLGWAEERGVTLELNSNANTPETAEVRMLRTVAGRGLPMVIGTDSHACAQVTNFSLARHRLSLAGLTVGDLNIPEIEAFIARKRQRHTAASRPRARGPVAHEQPEQRGTPDAGC